MREVNVDSSAAMRSSARRFVEIIYPENHERIPMALRTKHDITG
jgi:hypothetical protein